MSTQLKEKINISVDSIETLTDVDLADLCNITEQAIKAGGGFGWLRVPTRDILKLPHMGWNLAIPTNSKYNNLIATKNDYYFVHSYYFECADNDNILAETQYGTNFASIVGKENIYGVQFHPEKSSSQGLNLLKEFIGV